MDFLRWSLWPATGNTTYAIELVGGSNVKPQLCDGDHTSGKAFIPLLLCRRASVTADFVSINPVTSWVFIRFRLDQF